LVFFGQLAYIFCVRFNHFRAVKIPGKRVFDPGHGYLQRVPSRGWCCADSISPARLQMPLFFGSIAKPQERRKLARLKDFILLSKGSEELAGGRIPELSSVIRARRQDTSAVRTEVKRWPAPLQNTCP
jgi:hypothetical protein